MTKSVATPAVEPPMPRPVGSGREEAQARIRRFLDLEQPATPCLVIDLETVRERYTAISSALPGVGVFYAVKANPEPEVVGLLAAEGCSFDVASPAEIDLCLAQGAPAERISYSNPIKKAADVAYAFGRGVRLFVSDSEQDVRAIAEHAPGSAVLLRIFVSANKSTYPFGKKFGCDPEMATDLLRLASRLGLRALGVAFHAGSQQLDPHGWDSAIADAGAITAKLRNRLRAVMISSTTPSAKYSCSAPPLMLLNGRTASDGSRSFVASMEPNTPGSREP